MAAVPADLPLAPQADAAQDIAIEFAALGKRYPGAAADAPPALQNIDLRIRRGEIFGIIGRSGAGKSSLLRTINRLESPSSGRVLIDGVDIATLDSAALVALRRRIGMVFQHFNLLAAKTVADNIGLPLRIAGASRAAIEARVAELLELVGLGGRGRQYPARLSGGQKQRVGIARALAHHPQILLCDEATSALDPETTQAILQLLRDINRRLGITIVLITHEMSVIREVCDRVLVLDHGCIAESGPVWEVFGAPLHAATRALLQPLEHAGLPEDLAARLSAQPPDGAHEALIELSFTGSEGREPELGRIAAGLGGAVRLLHGGVDRIQGRSHGRLLLAVQRAAGAQVWPRSGRFAHSLKVLGYVTADA